MHNNSASNDNINSCTYVNFMLISAVDFGRMKKNIHIYVYIHTLFKRLSALLFERFG